MKKHIFILLAVLLSAVVARAQEKYFTLDEMPDLVKCLPAPPDTVGSDFDHDVLRYMWGKQMRLNPQHAAQARRDAVWDLDTLAAIFSVPFGREFSREKTPEIYKAFVNGVATIEQIRVRPKAHYMRVRPYVRYGEHTLFPADDEELSKEGSYPSGHTIRGWAAALVLAEINPAAAEKIFERGWDYGESRVIVGAHWQSDVDASRAAASIGYSFLQTSPAYRLQMEKARKEFLAWQERERTIITRSPSVMYVTTLSSDSDVLRARSLDVAEGEHKSKELKTLLDKMRRTVTSPSQDGVGIAAPQVGVNRRVVWVQRLDKKGEPFEPYVNIQIDSLWGDVVVLEEGCLSAPPLRGKVPRYSHVKISYLRDGKRVSEVVEGYTARIFQHECDHLDGILCIDRAQTVFTDSAWVAKRAAFSYSRPAWWPAE